MKPRLLGVKPLRDTGVERTGLYSTTVRVCLLWAYVGGARLPSIRHSHLCPNDSSSRKGGHREGCLQRNRVPVGTGGKMRGVEIFGFFPKEHVCSLQPSKVGMDGRYHPPPCCLSPKHLRRSCHLVLLPFSFHAYRGLQHLLNNFCAKSSYYCGVFRKIHDP